MKLLVAVSLVGLAQGSSSLLRGRSSQKASFGATRKAHEPGDRLADDCEEPAGYGETYAGGMGPDKIFCCKTAKRVVDDLTNRCEKDCNDNVPCSKTLEKWCGVYLDNYKQMKAEVCKPRPTTTTTTTTEEPTTTTTTAEITAAAEAGAPTTTTVDPLEWCYKLCGEVAQSNKFKDEASCKTFCHKAAEGFAKNGSPCAAEAEGGEVAVLDAGADAADAAKLEEEVDKEVAEAEDGKAAAGEAAEGDGAAAAVDAAEADDATAAAEAAAGAGGAAAVEGADAGSDAAAADAGADAAGDTEAADAGANAGGDAAAAEMDAASA